MANVLNVKPTKVELERLKNNLDLATSGYELLKSKQDELMRQFVDLVQENHDLRKEVEEGLTEVMQSYILAKASLKSEFVEQLAAVPSSVVSLDIYEKNIMSVIVPNMRFDYEALEEQDFEYGYLNSNSELDEALNRLTEIFPKLLELSQIEKTTQMLADEIESTRRRVNALEHKMIPDTKETIDYIEQKIEEEARETTTRMIKIKDR